MFTSDLNDYSISSIVALRECVAKMSNHALLAIALLLFVTTGRAEVRVRLVAGPGPYAGRLEVFYSSRWGTVCDRPTGFTHEAVMVVCYMLGYGHTGRYLSEPNYGAGSGTIWLYNVRCRGTEINIADCAHSSWGSRSNCDHGDDVSVTCIGIRLVGGPIAQNGRLEVRYNGTWGTVCQDDFNNEAARVICYMLGYRDVGYVIGNHYGVGSGRIWLDDVRCNGTEKSIADCQHSAWGGHNCRHDEDVSISCIKVRLIGSNDLQEGLLQVLYDRRWGAVCDDYFNSKAAGVVCYMLGYGHGGQVLGHRYGPGSRPIWLDDVRCNGTERSISVCKHSGFGHHNCRHEAVSVSCITVRLVGGPSPREGRLEVRYKGSWGTVCDDDFNDAAANVVCHMLGFKPAGRFIGNYYGAGNGTIWLDDIQCSGTERHISDCSHSVWGNHNCQHDEDVAVSCIDDSSASRPNGRPTIPASSYDIGLMSTTTQCGSSTNEPNITQIVIAVVVVFGILID